MHFKDKLLAAQQHLGQHDPKLRNLISEYGDCIITPHTDHYSELVTSIVGQQLSIKAAAAIWGRVLVLSGGKPPTPSQLIAASAEDLRSAGLSGPKINYVKDLALHIEDGRLDMDNISSLPNPEIIDQLTAVKGIGEWSAHMFMLFGLGRLDVLPWGDLGIRKAIMRVYELKELPEKNEILEIAEQNGWQPYESVAAWYLWKSLESGESIRIKDA
jgi:DNA-3-methyladenine glycosylase II